MTSCIILKLIVILGSFSIVSVRSITQGKVNSHFQRGRDLQKKERVAETKPTEFSTKESADWL